MGEALSLLELNSLVRKSIESCLPSTYWVSAELSDVHTNASGHCYLEFIQKNEQNSSMLAKARGMIWANLYNMLKPYFEEATGETFRSGLKVLVEVQVQFHELYGYSLVVVNIDPTYTVGDLVKKKQEIVQQLTSEGVINMNREIEFPILPQRIAVISSQSAAGYGDFCDQLSNNEYGFPFYVELFPAIMQGEQVEQTMLTALDVIFERQKEFDVVVIIRGGGATSDLSGFDTYMLAASCAQFPLPIITGIGHERDDTILDLVANKRVKTPTAAAEFIIARVLETTSELYDLSQRFRQGVKEKLSDANQELKELQYNYPSIVKMAIKDQQYRIEVLQSSMKSSAKLFITQEFFKLESLQTTVRALSPELVLKRGYAIIRQHDKIVTSIAALDRKSEVLIEMKDGTTETKLKESYGKKE